MKKIFRASVLSLVWFAFLGPMSLSGQTPHPVPDKNAAQALYMKGLGYFQGHGQQRDPVQARLYFEQAAEAGNAQAQAALGFLYLEGLGVEKNENEGVKWLRMAADQHLASAQHNLAIVLLRRSSEKKEEVLGLLTDSAERGFLPSQMELGEIFYFGKFDIQADSKQAAKYMKMAAEQGNPSAQNYTGIMYENGIGLEKNPSEAVRWVQKAAAQGEPKALSNLARYYGAGLGVEQSSMRAYVYMVLAFRMGEGAAEIQAGEFRKKLTVEEVAEADKIIENFGKH